MHVNNSPYNRPALGRKRPGPETLTVICFTLTPPLKVHWGRYADITVYCVKPATAAALLVLYAVIDQAIIVIDIVEIGSNAGGRAAVILLENFIHIGFGDCYCLVLYNRIGAMQGGYIDDRKNANQTDADYHHGHNQLD